MAATLPQIKPQIVTLTAYYGHNDLMALQLFYIFVILFEIPLLMYVVTCECFFIIKLLF